MTEKFDFVEACSPIKIGINSKMIKEISNGPILPEEVDLIEIGIKDAEVLNGEINFDRLNEFKSFNTNFAIHAPYTNDNNGNAVDLGVKSQKNFKVMEKVFEIAQFLNAEYVVIHGDEVNGDFRKSFLNVISNLTFLSNRAEDYSITLLLENLHKENGHDRVGILPHEIRQVIESVNKDSLKVCFDVGHGHLAANLYNLDIVDYIRQLSPHIYHVHIHDNLGIPAVIDEKYGDQHLPLGHGKIDYVTILNEIRRTNVENLVLELRPTATRDDVLDSIRILKDFRNGANPCQKVSIMNSN